MCLRERSLPRRWAYTGLAAKEKQHMHTLLLVSKSRSHCYAGVCVCVCVCLCTGSRADRLISLLGEMLTLNICDAGAAEQVTQSFHRCPRGCWWRSDPHNKTSAHGTSVCSDAVLFHFIKDTDSPVCCAFGNTGWVF